jgi:hypothetical protein
VLIEPSLELDHTVVFQEKDMNTAGKLTSYALAAAMTLLLAEAASGQMSGPGGKSLPKLVLFLVIDGFPQEQFVRYYDQYGPRGFKLWLDQGAWYVTSIGSLLKAVTAIAPASASTLAPNTAVFITQSMRTSANPCLRSVI